jgi:hypothetical protein
MLKLTLDETYREAFIQYSLNRIARSGKEYHYLTRNILTNTFTFFINHKLTVEEDAKSYWYINGKKEIESYGYSGYSSNERDDIQEMTENLYHHIFCKAEWIARSLTQTWYIETVRQTIGTSCYRLITA